MKKAGSVVADMLKRGSLDRTLRLGEIWASWEKIAGPELAPYSRPVKCVGKALYVEVDGAPAHHKASFMKGAILSRVRAFTGGRYIKDIVFKLRSKCPRPQETLPSDI